MSARLMLPGLSAMLKRVFDVVVSATLLMVMSLPLCIIGVSIFLALGRPVLFIQRRPGRGARPFSMIKFRTMTEELDQAGRLLPDEQRFTRFGAFLRASSLDELPELWNVLKGDMSLVGPRPLLVEYLPLYSPLQSRRHQVRPGITGWAQINGRNSLTWGEKFKLDVWYVQHRTMRLDLKILCLTVLRVLHRDGINPAGSVITPKFLGAQDD